MRTGVETPRLSGAALAVTLIAIAALAADWLPLLRGPAPYPPEWQWEYRHEPTSGRFLPALVPAAALLALVGLTGTRRAGARPRAASVIVLASSVLAGAAFSLGLMALEPDGALRTLMQRTRSRTVTSYHAVAASPEAEDPLAFLRRHHELLPEWRGPAKHAATHPPGPVLFYRGLIAVCGALPRLSQAALDAAGIRPEPADDDARRRAVRAAALLGPVLLIALCAATCLPIAALARLAGCDRLAAARVGALWGLVPGPALMAPQFDQALALPVTLAAVLLAAALKSSGARRASLLAAAAAASAALALSISYGAAAFLAVAAAAAAALVPGTRPTRATWVAAVAALAALGLWLAPALAGARPWASARTALAIHRELYTQPRSAALWLLFNPLDLAIFLGLPVTWLWVTRTADSLRRFPSPSLTAGDRLRVGSGLALLALLLSTGVRGELGRIGIPLMPVLLVAAVAPDTQARGASGPGAATALLLAALLAALCLTLKTCWRL